MFMGFPFLQMGDMFSPGPADRITQLWDLEGNKIQTFTGAESVSFSPDGKYILTGNERHILDGYGYRTARLWDLQGNNIQTFKGAEPIFSHDGKYILTLSEDNTVKIWHNPMHSFPSNIYQFTPEERKKYDLDITQ